MDRDAEIAKAIKAFDSRKSLSDIQEDLFKQLCEKYPPDEAKKLLDEALKERRRIAARRYVAKYDKENKDMFRSITMKFNKVNDKDVLGKLDSVPNKQGYVKKLIRTDIAQNGM